MLDYSDYSDFSTYQEIFHQPEMWNKTFQYLVENKKRISSFMSTYYNDNVNCIFTGAGTSSFIGDVLSFVLPRKGLHNTISVPTTDITTHPSTVFDKNKKYLLISFARSGNSPESIAAFELANVFCGKNIGHIIITCNIDGELGKRAAEENSLLIDLPPETNDKGLAMTSSFTSMLLAATLIFDINKIENHNGNIGNLTKNAKNILLRYPQQLKDICSLNFERAVFLGSGALKGIAHECYLKLEELTDGKVSCAFDSFLGFRHGPKAILNDKTLLIYLFSEDKYVKQYEEDLVKEINQQISPVGQIYVGPDKANIENVTFHPEITTHDVEASPFDFIVYVIIGQLLGFYKSLDLGLNPDTPSNDGKISRVVQGVNIYEYCV